MDQDPAILDMFDIIQTEKGKAEKENQKKQEQARKTGGSSRRVAGRRGRR